MPNVNVCGSQLYVCFGVGDEEAEMGCADSLREAIDAARAAAKETGNGGR